MEEGDAQSEGATREPVAGPPQGEPEQEPMETNPPDSPVSPNEDDLLTRAGATAAGMEMELASLQVTSLPEGHQQASS